MTTLYQPKSFLRSVPAPLLKQYFARHDCLAEVDFSAKPKARLEAIYQAWLKLPQTLRNEMEQDFQEIHGLATEGGVRAIMKEALKHGENLADQFSKLGGFHGIAFWTFLERQDYWSVLLLFKNVDNIPYSYWRKHKGLPPGPIHLNPTQLKKFENAIIHCFHAQGRGQHCKVRYEPRDGLHYFFVYVEDYAQGLDEFIDHELEHRTHRPALEIVFLYLPKENRLDIFLKGDKTALPELQAIFADVFFNAQLGENPKDKEIYALDKFLDPHFNFWIEKDSGITNVILTSLRFCISGQSGDYQVRINNPHEPMTVVNMVKQITKSIPLNLIHITQVGVKVTFAPNPLARRQQRSTRSFSISASNACSLHYTGRDLIIRKMLADSGIEPQEAHEPPVLITVDGLETA